MILGPAFEAPTVISGFDDVAVVSEAIEQRRCHLGIRKDVRPFTKSEVGRNDDRGSLVETTDEVEQELPAGLGEGQIAEFIQDDKVHASQMISKAALAGVAGLGLEPIAEIDYVIEPTAGAGSDATSGDRDGKMSLAGASQAHDILPKNRCLTLSSDTRIIRAPVNASPSYDDSFMRVASTLSSNNQMAVGFCCRRG